MEVWKRVVGFERYYQVSNKGNIKRVDGSSHLKSRNLKLILDKDGYPRVNLKVKQKTNSKYVHRLVAKAFIPNNENKPQVNHKDGVKNNNDISNLEWVTLSENRQHAYDIGLQNSFTRRGSLNNFNKLSKDEVLKIRSLYSEDLRGIKKDDFKGRLTMKDISLMFNITEGCVQSIISRKTWKHL